VGVQEEGGLQNQPGYQPGELRVLQIDARRREERALLDAVEDYQQLETGGQNARVEEVEAELLQLVANVVEGLE